jgi:hypothetical protein
VRALSGTSRIGGDVTGELERVLVEVMLDGAPHEAALERLRERFDAESVDAQRDAIAAHAARIRATLLAPLLAEEAS